MYIYFVRQKNGGPIKIGATSELKQRLSVLQVGNPNQLEIIGVCRGSLAGERMLRVFFDDDSRRYAGEWIAPTEQLLRLIDRLPSLTELDAGADCPEIVAPADRYRILRRAGFTLQEIGDHYGVSRQLVHKVSDLQLQSVRSEPSRFREKNEGETIIDYMAEISAELAQGNLLLLEGDL